MSLTILSRISPATPDGRLAIELARWLEQFTGEPVWIRPISVQGIVPEDVRERFVYGDTPGTCELMISDCRDSFALTPKKKRLLIKPSLDCLDVIKALRLEGALGAPSTIRTQGPGHAYYHSGNLGDLIYGLYAIRENGGGQLLCGGKQRNKNLFAPITHEQWKLLKPLLDAQPYLQRCGWREHYPAGEIKWDMNVFRDWWLRWALRQWESLHNLCEMQFYYLDIRDKFVADEPWLELPSEIETGRIVIHRSPRYNQDDTPWYWLTKNLRSSLLFVGLAEEHAEFERKFGPVSYWKCRDFLEMAQIIGGANGFVGGQSFPMSLALGLGQRVWQETCELAPDCLYQRESFHNGDIEIVKEWA